MKVKYTATINLEIEDEIDDLTKGAKEYIGNNILKAIKDEILDEITLLKIDSKLFLDGKEVKE